MGGFTGLGPWQYFFPEDEMETVASGVIAAGAAIGSFLFFRSMESSSTGLAIGLATVTAVAAYGVSVEAMWWTTPFSDLYKPPAPVRYNNDTPPVYKHEPSSPIQTKVTDFFAVKTKHPLGAAKDENTFVLNNDEYSPKTLKK